MSLLDYATDTGVEYQYNGDDYVVLGTFINDSYENKNVLPLRGKAFRYIEITDNIYHPFHTAEIILSNDINFFDKEYSYLGNGRDRLILVISPKTPINARPPLTNEDFQLKFDFVIVECVDVNYQNSICKKLKLVESKEYKLSETFFNYGEIKKSMPGFSYLNTNTGNSKSTGEWIKQILKSVYPEMGEELFIKDNNYNEIFESKDSLDINLSLVGTIPNIKVLNYIMQFHKHNDSPCLLRYDRVKKAFGLISYETLFKNHQNFCNEEMHFGRSTHDGEMGSEVNYTKNANINYAHLSRVSDVSQFGKNGADSSIQEFYIEPPAASLVIDFFAKESLSVYSRAYGSFLYDTQILAPDTIINTYKEKFLKPFENLFDKYALKENFYLPQSDQHMRDMWKQRTDSLSPDMTVAQFELKKLSNLLNLNYTYILKCRGSTARQSATFVDVLKFDKEKNELKPNSPTDFDMKHLGRHLVTCVKHIFVDNAYINRVETIKPYRLLNKDELALLSNGSSTGSNPTNLGSLLSRDTGSKAKYLSNDAISKKVAAGLKDDAYINAASTQEEREKRETQVLYGTAPSSAGPLTITPELGF